ncbi:hypothetical protein GLOIN_2v615733 [Rhizophagus clarus]|uniref:Uncharacterized protein n=1 Tax=Rhizophagus clarus TaxID=94130 RepID=A0A8H3QFD6_9GLOM|nr:hypothetical protein GLOIN_2v615733 [Rhizophagus clarus]
MRFLQFASAIGRVIVLMGRWNDQDFDYGTNATMTLGQNTAKESDSWIRPRQRADSPAGSGLSADKNAKAYQQ